MEKIKILIVDNIKTSRENTCKLLEFNPQLLIVGQAPTSEEAIILAKELHPDIILIDINTQGMDSIETAEAITNDLPNANVLIMSTYNEQGYFRRAMLAGAKDYLVKPFTGNELLSAIERLFTKELKRKKNLNTGVPESGKIITIFSSKGGIGKTTISTNLAIALGQKTDASIGLIDADLQFGDVALFLNLLPRVTIADLIRDIDNLDAKLLESYITPYKDRLSIISAPFRLEQAERITGAHMTALLKTMRKRYSYTLIDTASVFNEVLLAILDQSDVILLIVSMDLPAIKNTKMCLEVMESLGYSSDKLKLLLNHTDTEVGIDIKEVEENLRYRFSFKILNDSKIIIAAINKGIPFIVSAPKSAIAQNVFALADTIVSGNWDLVQKENESLLKKIKKLFI